MLSYLTIGANDLKLCGRFYEAVLVPLGYTKSESPEGIEFTAPPGSSAGTIYIVRPFDGRPATPANGIMPAFQSPTQSLVRALHEAGRTAGGTDEGAPGFRAAYSANFYVAYLRDPVGNKLALFCNNPAEGTRPT